MNNSSNEDAKRVIDSLRERPESVQRRLDRFGLREPATLSDEEAEQLMELVED